MKLRLVIAALAAAPLLALAQAPLPTKPAAKGAAPAGGTLATVNGVAIPANRLEFAMQEQTARGAPDSDQVRAQMKDNLINREVVLQEATRAGYPKQSEVQQQIEWVRQQIIVDAYVADYLRKNPISDAEVQKAYDQFKAQQGDREYRARHILVDSEDQAKDLIAQLRKGAKFDELASKHTKDSGTKERGGDLDWNVPGVFDKQFADAMVKLDKGKVTDAPVRTRFGFHVIQLDDVRTTRFPPLNEVKPRIQQQLAGNKVQEMVRGLRAKAKVE